MELREWQYMNKPAGSATNNSSSVFRSRLKKLAGYAYRYKNSKVTSVDILKLTDNEIKFAEFFESEVTAEFEISIKPTTEDWNLKIYINNSYEGRKQILDASGTGWVELLKELRCYITIPTTGTPDYKDLLTESLLNEWTLMSPPVEQAQAANVSSSGYKKRFEKLLKYHLDKVSKVPMLGFEKLTRKAVTDYGFRLGEIYNISSGKLDRTVIVTVDSSGTFYLRIEVDGRTIYSNSYESYEELINTLAYYYLVLPDAGTPDYDDLLTESLNEWQLINPPAQQAQATSSKLQSQVRRYSKLLKQIDADRICTRRINKFNDTTLDLTLNTAKTHDLNIKIVYDPVDDDYELITNGRTSLSGCDYEKDILPLLIAGGIISNTNLCESAESSIADDFKLYENLWENI